MCDESRAHRFNAVAQRTKVPTRFPGRMIMRMLAIMLMTTIGLVGLGAKSGAQTGAPVPRAETRLITLGTAGGPFPRGKRAQSSNLLIVNGTPYLIDAGDGVARRLAKLEFNFRSLSTIFITHGHNDHIGGLGHLMSVQWLQLVSEVVSVEDMKEVRIRDGR